MPQLYFKMKDPKSHKNVVVIRAVWPNFADWFQVEHKNFVVAKPHNFAAITITTIISRENADLPTKEVLLMMKIFQIKSTTITFLYFFLQKRITIEKKTEKSISQNEPRAFFDLTIYFQKRHCFDYKRYTGIFIWRWDRKPVYFLAYTQLHSAVPVFFYSSRSLFPLRWYQDSVMFLRLWGCFVSTGCECSPALYKFWQFDKKKSNRLENFITYLYSY